VSMKTKVKRKERANNARKLKVRMKRASNRKKENTARLIMPI